MRILKRNHQLMPGSALIVQRKKNLDPCNYSIATCRPYSCYNNFIHYSIFGFTLLKHSYSIVFDISIWQHCGYSNGYHNDDFKVTQLKDSKIPCSTFMKTVCDASTKSETNIKDRILKKLNHIAINRETGSVIHARHVTHIKMWLDVTCVKHWFHW